MTRSITHLSEVLESVDGLLLDQFGVLHDGEKAFPGAIECVQTLQERGMPIVALSNSGRRAKPNADRLARLGFPMDAFKAVVTSGELTRDLLLQRLADNRLSRGGAVLLLSRENDRSLIDDLPLTGAREGEPVELVIISGNNPETHSREDYRRFLTPLAQAGVPAICANPDTTIYAGGQASYGPGLVAKDYADAGGEVVYLGKPDAAMFSAGLQALGPVTPDRCLMIGDSPRHDILGGNRAGCRTLLITSGVQAGTPDGETAADFSMEKLRF
ncbi:HAD superfamily hydrolase (TIGR01459 family) [Labrenzia sp. MBR-25]|jgi:HAD superfamily hydrolase (TIGR01459 family)